MHICTQENRMEINVLETKGEKQQIKGGIIVKKNRTKRILSMLLTLCMVLTLVPMTAFAANAPADSVTINGVTLDSSYPYLVSGVKQSSGSLNGTDCTAHLNVATGTLSLWNYNGNAIAAGGAGGAKDLTVKLKGTNTITGDLSNYTDGGNLMITAEEDASLNITYSNNSDRVLAGISTDVSGLNSGGGSISITGKANITISVTNTSTNDFAKSYGLFAKQGISISDSASLDVTSTCHSSSDYSAYGIYTENQSFTADTSGVIRVDVSNTQNANPTAISAGSYSLTKVNQLLCKYNSTGYDFYGAFTPPAGLAYNKGVVSGTPTTEIRGGSTPVRTATFVGGTNNFGEWTGQYFSGDSVELSANTFGIPFSSWQSSAGSFSSTTSPNTTFTMPNEDVTITARYNAFNVQPSFTKTESGKGTIIFNLHALPDSDPRLVTKTGDETNIVGGKYFYGDNLSREETIFDGTGPYNVPAGEYRVAVKIGYLWHFSEVFTVNYDAPVTTYAVAVTGGTGGGNYAEGATVSITANAPATGKVFDKWTTSDGVTFANENSANTTFVMPAKAVTVTATYKDAPVTTYAVTVNSGTGGGDFAEGATVSITANEPATGKVFDKWTTSDGVTFGDENTATTTFVMPAKAVTVTATYKDAPVTTYAVTVNSGTGGGNFAEGATVSITANAPATGKVFDKWTTSDGVTFANANSATTTFVMPAKAVTVTATYKDAPVTALLAPTKVKAKAGKKKVTVTFAKASGASKYKIYRSAKKTKGYKAIKTTTKTKYVDKKVKKGKRYYYKVKSIRTVIGTVNSGYSKIVRSKKVR